jgi:hypothetical protein
MVRHDQNERGKREEWGWPSSPRMADGDSNGGEEKRQGGPGVWRRVEGKMGKREGDSGMAGGQLRWPAAAPGQRALIGRAGQHSVVRFDFKPVQTE